MEDWNPDVILEKREVEVPPGLRAGELDPARVKALSALVGQSDYKVFDVPAPGRVKIYFDKATLHVRFAEGKASYEEVRRRPLFYEVNFIHRNGYKPWKWASDLFGLFLILITISGLLLLRGRQGFGGRGKWFALAGAIPPALVLLLELS